MEKIGKIWESVKLTLQSKEGPAPHRLPEPPMQVGQLLSTEPRASELSF